MSDDRRELTVNLGPRSYQIQIVNDGLKNCASTFESWWNQRDGMSSAFLSSQGRARQTDQKGIQPFTLVLTDTNVAASHATSVANSLKAAGWRVETEILPAGEHSKSLSMIERVYDRLISLNADRRTVIIAVGGGVIGDAAGFVAATYMRGLPFIQVPTTLLSAVDSSVGGKTGVNHPTAKNMIGAFYQPIGVLIDTASLQTLPDLSLIHI